MSILNSQVKVEAGACKNFQVCAEEHSSLFTFPLIYQMPFKKSIPEILSFPFYLLMEKEAKKVNTQREKSSQANTTCLPPGIKQANNFFVDQILVYF